MSTQKAEGSMQIKNARGDSLPTAYRGFKIESRKSKIEDAFTLTELLVVIGLIVLLVALAIPAFSYITGARSVEGGRNVVNGMLSRARVEAIRGNTTAGVFFYPDAATGQTRAVFVTLGSGVDPDPLQQYKAWQTGVQYSATDGTTGKTADIVAFPTADNQMGGRLFIKLYRCIQDNTSSPPPTTGGPNFSNAFWQEYVPGLELLADSEPQYLPKGVGVQTINDPGGSTASDRYLRHGGVLFDSQGRLTTVSYSILAKSNLGAILGLTSDIGDIAGDRMIGQLGYAIYESQLLAGFGGTDGDYAISVPNIPSPASYGTASVPANGDEADEEVWLDENASQGMVNRGSGVVMDLVQ